MDHRQPTSERHTVHLAKSLRLLCLESGGLDNLLLEKSENTAQRHNTI